MIHKKKFYFIRHGRTDWNDLQLCQGHKDIPLNVQGRQEILSIIPFINTLPLTTLIASPLSRAFESAQIIQQHILLPLHTFDELKERYWGQKEGISSQEMYQIEQNESLSHDFGIEPISQFDKRIISGINKALEYEQPLIISHGRLFLSLTRIMGIQPINQIPNAAVIECTPTSSTWSIKIH